MFKVGDRIIYEYNQGKPRKGVVTGYGQKGDRIAIKLDNGDVGNTNIKNVRLDREINEL